MQETLKSCEDRGDILLCGVLIAVSVLGDMRSGCALLGKHQKCGKFYWMLPKVAYPNQSGLEGIALLAVHFCLFLWSKTGSREAKRKKEKENIAECFNSLRSFVLICLLR